ncbi:MAG: FHA domain-containing protein [Leucobacter sp.]
MPSTAATASSPRAAALPPTAVPPPLPRLSGHSDADAQVVEFALLSGQRARIHGTTVLGRMPEATARNAGAQAIAIPDDTKSISRAHAIIERQGQAVTISDAGSANGSVIERDGTAIEIAEGQEISLRDGDRIWLGDVPLDVHISRPTKEASQ